MGLACLLMPKLVGGPVGSLYMEAFAGCKKYWWTNLLLINNFYPMGATNCMWWTWILSICFQLYLVLPLIVILFRFNKIAGYATLSVLMLGSLIALTL